MLKRLSSAKSDTQRAGTKASEKAAKPAAKSKPAKKDK
jgi:hypothetical protein